MSSTDGAIVPWKAHKTVFVGQWFLSTRFYEKLTWSAGLFKGPHPMKQGLTFWLLPTSLMCLIVHVLGPLELCPRLMD